MHIVKVIYLYHVKYLVLRMLCFILIFFLLQGLQRHFSAIHVLQSVESFFRTGGACCKSNTSSFTIDVIIYPSLYIFIKKNLYIMCCVFTWIITSFYQITASNDHFKSILINKEQECNEASTCQYMQEISGGSSSLHPPLNNVCFRISVSVSPSFA